MHSKIPYSVKYFLLNAMNLILNSKKFSNHIQKKILHLKKQYI